MIFATGFFPYKPFISGRNEFTSVDTIENPQPVFERIILKRRTDGLYDPTRGVTAHREHLNLLQAMKKRNAQNAVKIVRAHIRAGKENVLSDLRQRQEIREFRYTGTVS